MHTTRIYKMAFGHDEASVRALLSLIEDRWHIEGFEVAEGHSWLILTQEILREEVIA